MEVKGAIKQIPTFAKRTYKGGKVLREFLGYRDPRDDFYPEDWISSFTEAKNKDYVKDEGISRAATSFGTKLITEIVDKNDFGQGRRESGVLIKLLDSAERLSIQVHPTKEYAKKIFDSEYGKTECWYILGKRDSNACVYLGFKEYVTREVWKDLFDRQDIDGMLGAMHRFEVNEGDVILVRGGMPHAIGGGCFLLEIQEPTDYTMRVERITVAGEHMTPLQLHCGAGEDALMDCFDYTSRSFDETKKLFFIKGSAEPSGALRQVSYSDTPCFALDLVDEVDYTAKNEHFVTVVALKNSGELICNNESFKLKRGDRFFIPSAAEFTLKGARAVICYPPKKG
ncbi:MAG: class I mannose-6-phosphate isomerase [Clostridia bacterium]|nr:class I mannose-6-phosphate isomerase [Clostridia bacterium]